MERLTGTGIIESLELATSKTGNAYIKMNTIRSIYSQQKGYVLIHENFSIFNEGVINSFNNGDYQIGDAIVYESYVTADAYQGRDGTQKASVNKTITFMESISLATRVKESTSQQPQAYNQQVQNQQGYGVQPQQPAYNQPGFANATMQPIAQQPQPQPIAQPNQFTYQPQQPIAQQPQQPQQQPAGVNVVAPNNNNNW